MRRIVIILISFLLLLASFIAWLGLTESGLALVITQAEKFVPELTIQKTSGRFYDGAEFDQINYQIDDSSAVAISHLTINWQAMQLFSGRVVIDKLHIGDVVITQGSKKETASSPVILPNITIPLAVSLKNLSVGRVSLEDQTKTKHPLISRLTSDIKLWRDKLHIQSLVIEYQDNIHFQLGGEVTLSDQYKTDLSYQWSVIDPSLKEIKAEGTINGNLDEIKLKQQLAKPVPSTQVITLSDVLGSLNWDVEIHLPQLEIADFIEGQSGRINSLMLKAAGDLTQAQIMLDTKFKQTDFPELSLHSQMSSSAFENWQTDTTFSTADGMTLLINGEINQVQTTPSLALKGQWQQLAWPMNEQIKSFVSNNGEFRIKGDADNYAISMAGDLKAENETFTWLANAQGTANQIDLNQFQITGLQGQVALAGWFNWQSEPHFELSADWHDIVIPEALSALKIATKHGVIKLSGSTTLFTASSDIDLSIDAIPTAINLKGTGSEKGFSELAVDTTIDDGQVSFKGHVLWLDDFNLNGIVKLTNINPKLFAPQWPGEISGGLSISANNLTAEAADIRIDELDVKGILRKRPVHLQGALTYLQQQLTIPQLQITSGQSAISVSGHGHLKEALDLNWNLQSPDLADFYPDLRGQLNAEGTVAGKSASPTIVASLSGQKVVYSDIVSINKLSSDLRIDMRSQGQFKGNVLLSDVNIETIKGLTTELTLSGTMDKHQLTFDLDNKDLTASGQLSGVLTDKGWQGQLSKLTLEQIQAGLWTLTEQGQIKIASDQGLIDRHCLHSSNGDVCIQAQYSPEGAWQGDGQFNHLSMNVLHAFSSALEPVEGELNGHFEIGGIGQYPTLGQGQINLDKGKLSLTAFDQKEQKLIPLKTFKFDFQLTDKVTMANVLIVPELKGLSAVTGQIVLPDLKSVMNEPDKAMLSGAFKTKVDDLSVFDALNSQYENLKGHLDVDLSLAGTVKSPALVGQIVMDKASVELPDFGLLLTELNATAKGSLDDGIVFSYQATSGKGQLVGDGKFVTNDTHWQLNADIKGDNVELMNLPEAYVVASHDLKISVSDARSEVSGSVTVPEAELAPLQFNMPVSPSKDVVILTNEPKAEETPFPTILDVNLTLGDKVKISAVGFNGRLTGNLLVSGDADKIVLGTGAIIIKEGKYTAYGQKLAVDDGQILFSGGAIDNPQLNIKAVRKGDDFTAGLLVEGAANNPQITLFSSPSMSQDNILAHIILGRPLGDASATDAAILASAATGLGIKGGNQMGERIASTFGLDSVAISGDGGEDTALQIGKYLSPRLYIGYGIGIFEPVSTVIMRYKLSKIWSLKAESGVETSVDFLYTHER